MKGNFSKMKYIKAHYRSVLTDKHFQSILLRTLTLNSNECEMLSLKKRILLISKPVLQKKKTYLIIFFYFISKNFICRNLLSPLHIYMIYYSTYIIFSVLPLGLQIIKYLPLTERVCQPQARK